MATNRKNPLSSLAPAERNPSSGPLDAMSEAIRGNAQLMATTSNYGEMWPLRDDIDGTRWNKSYPYQLLVLKANGGSSYSVARAADTAGDLKSTTFTLPIPPQSMVLSTPFAIDLAVTLGGIVEQHNGAPLRTISFSGTTGVAPLRGTGNITQTNSLPASIAVGTIQAAGNFLTTVSALTDNAATNNRVMGESFDELIGTGYYQFRLLQDFLESYVRAKKKAKHTDLRLAVAVWKDEAVYLVTPLSFDVQRAATQPWHYDYSLSFRAFRRVKLDADPGYVEPFKPVTRDPDAMRYALSKIRQARAVMRAHSTTLKAIVADADRLVDEPMREAILFLKDATGSSLTLADMPSSVGRQVLSSWLAARENWTRALNSSWSKLTERYTQWGANLSAETNKGKTGSGTSAPPPSGTSYNQGAHQLNKLFDNVRENLPFFDGLRLTDVSLPVVAQGLVQSERYRVRELTRKDFEAYRDQIQTVAATFAESVGAGDPTYNSIYGTPDGVAIRKTSPSDDDYEILHALNDTILQLNKLAADTEVTTPKITTSEVVAGMANASGIAFRVPVSKFPVPLPYGQTLEQLATQYLGDPDRWIEIATLNGLQNPYIDEEGFVSRLKVNGAGNSIQVDRDGRYFPGQPVWISSARVIREKRYVEFVSSDDTYTYLTLAGEPDMDRLDVNDDAQVWAFLPNTANSQQLIYIPSEDSVPEEYSTPAIPGLADYDNEIRVGGVSLLLTGDGDLALTPDGHSRLAIGVTNVLQRIRVAIGTAKGSLIRHPEYGLGIQVGASTADIDVKDVAIGLKSLLANDPAVLDIRDVRVSKQGPVLKINLSIQLVGASRLIPISVDVT